MSNIKHGTLAPGSKNSVTLKQIKYRFFWVFIVVWFAVSGPGFFNYLYNLAYPINTSITKSQRGVASLQHIKGLTNIKSETLIIGDKYYECEISLPNITKGCKGIPADYIESEVLVHYISIPWEPSRVSSDYPVSIKKIKSGSSTVLIKDIEKFVNDKLAGDVESSVIGSIIISIIGFCIIKSINYIERKQ